MECSNVKDIIIQLVKTKVRRQPNDLELGTPETRDYLSSTSENYILEGRPINRMTNKVTSSSA